MDKTADLPIPVFEDTDDLYEAIGFARKGHIPNFDIFALEDLGHSVRKCMPPYRQGFYQISLLDYTGDTRINLNTDWLELEEYPLWFGPGRVDFMGQGRENDRLQYHVQKGILDQFVSGSDQ